MAKVKTAPLDLIVRQKTNDRIAAKVTVVPGLYFKSYSIYTEARIPFEIFGLISMVENSGYNCHVVDFNIKSDDQQFEHGQISFPSLCLDENFYQNAGRALQETSARIYIFLVSIHTNGNMFHSLRMARELKEREPDSLIVFSGLGPSSRSADVFKGYPEVDLVVHGEAEATIAELLLQLKPLARDHKPFPAETMAEVRGVSWHADGEGLKRNPPQPLIDDLDDLPFPSFEYYGNVMRQISDFTKDIQFLSVEENIHLEFGRGCPFDCTFCSNGYLWQRRYRLKSPQRMIEEIRACKEKFGATKFLFHQQLFTANKKKTLEFCEALIASKLDIEWSCFTRNDCLDDEILAAMKAAGCNTMMFGIESGSQRIQDLVEKKTILTDVRKQIQRTMDYGIKPQLSYIVGFPEETPEDLQQTVDMYLEYKYQDNVESQIGLLAPAGGIKLLDQYEGSLLFDGIQTTTWYTRFFDETSADEMQKNPLAYPQNFYFETPHLDRDLLIFIKVLDIVASYLTATIKYVSMDVGLNIPYGLHEAYKRWRLGKPADHFHAKNFDGQIKWDTEECSVLVDFAQFLDEAIFSKADEHHFIRDVMQYELTYAMLNERIRENFYEKICTSARSPFDVSDNPVHDPYQPVVINTSYDVLGILRELEDKPHVSDPERFETAQEYKLVAADGTKIMLVISNVRGSEQIIQSVYRQVEF